MLLTPWLAGILVVVGFLFMWAGAKAQSFEQVTGGLLELTLGLSLLVGVVVLHLVGAREVRFTRDSLVVRQTGRRELVLPYCEYQHEWVADLSNPHVVRLIVFGFNRGCMLVLPPEWVVGALREVRRIQEEEGWYSPEGR